MYSAQMAKQPWQAQYEWAVDAEFGSAIPVHVQYYRAAFANDSHARMVMYV